MHQTTPSLTFSRLHENHDPRITQGQLLEETLFETPITISIIHSRIVQQ